MDYGSFAVATSADGSVVVGSRNTNTGGAFGLPPSTEAFRWTGGVMTGLGDLPGGAFSSVAYATSANGSVAVGSGTSASGTEAAIWDSQNQIWAVKQLLIDAGVTGLENWTLSQATAVSADGRTIVGYGLHPSGHVEAWVATIPEPTTGLLLTLGLAGLGMRRRVR